MSALHQKGKTDAGKISEKGRNADEGADPVESKIFYGVRRAGERIRLTAWFTVRENKKIK